MSAEAQTRLPWTAEEDAILISLVERYGEKRWNMVANGLPGRTGKGCSHRWRTYLRPDVKHPHLEPFTEWEAAVIVQAQRDMGNNWLAIAKLLLPGRSNTAVKNFWHCRLKNGSGTNANRFIVEGYNLEYLLNEVPHESRLHPVALPAFPSTAPTGQLHPAAKEAALLEMSAAGMPHPGMMTTDDGQHAHGGYMDAAMMEAASHASAALLGGAGAAGMPAAGFDPAVGAGVPDPSIDPKEDLRRRASAYVQQQLALMGQPIARHTSGGGSTQTAAASHANNAGCMLPPGAAAAAGWAAHSSGGGYDGISGGSPLASRKGAVSGGRPRGRKPGSRARRSSEELDESYVPSCRMSRDEEAAAAVRSSDPCSSPFMLSQHYQHHQHHHVASMGGNSSSTGGYMPGGHAGLGVQAPLMANSMADYGAAASGGSMAGISGGGEAHAGGTTKTAAAAAAELAQLTWDDGAGFSRFSIGGYDLGLEAAGAEGAPPEPSGAAAASGGGGASRRASIGADARLLPAELDDKAASAFDAFMAGDFKASLSNFKASLGNIDDVLCAGPGRASHTDWAGLFRGTSLDGGAQPAAAAAAAAAGDMPPPPPVPRGSRSSSRGAMPPYAAHGYQQQQQQQAYEQVCYQQHQQHPQLQQQHYYQQHYAHQQQHYHEQHYHHQHLYEQQTAMMPPAAYNVPHHSMQYGMAWQLDSSGRCGAVVHAHELHGQQQHPAADPAAAAARAISSPTLQQAAGGQQHVSPFKLAAVQPGRVSPELVPAAAAAAAAAAAVASSDGAMEQQQGSTHAAGCSSGSHSRQQEKQGKPSGPPLQQQPFNSQPKMPADFDKVLNAILPSPVGAATGRRPQASAQQAAGAAEAATAAANTADAPPAAGQEAAAGTSSCMAGAGPAGAGNGAGQQPAATSSQPAAPPVGSGVRLKVECPDAPEQPPHLQASGGPRARPSSLSLSPVGRIFGSDGEDGGCELLLDDDIAMGFDLQTPKDDNPQTRAERRSLRMLLGLLSDPAAAPGSDALAWGRRRSSAGGAAGGGSAGIHAAKLLDHHHGGRRRSASARASHGLLSTGSFSFATPAVAVGGGGGGGGSAECMPFFAAETDCQPGQDGRHASVAAADHSLGGCVPSRKRGRPRSSSILAAGHGIPIGGQADWQPGSAQAARAPCDVLPGPDAKRPRASLGGGHSHVGDVLDDYLAYWQA